MKTIATAFVAFPMIIVASLAFASPGEYRKGGYKYYSEYGEHHEYKGRYKHRSRKHRHHSRKYRKRKSRSHYYKYKGHHGKYYKRRYRHHDDD